MLTFDEALAAVAMIPPLGSETVSLEAAAGRVLAHPVTARLPAPRATVAAMDGYAVQSGEPIVPGLRLHEVGAAFAGRPFGAEVGPGEAVRIFTGAILPAGAGRVIVQENVEREGSTVTIVRPSSPKTHVRRAASDFAASDVLLPSGALLTPRAMVAAAAADHAELVVTVKPAVSIIVTGDELARPGGAHAYPTAIPESVSFGVAALVAEWGGIILARFHGRDRADELQSLAGEALERSDLIVITGGASVGERDFAKVMFAPFGLDMLVPKVAMKPGKPVWLARVRGRTIVGLPGNPTSAMVTARLLLAPVLAALTGRRTPLPLDWRHLPLASPLRETGDRETFIRANCSENGLSSIADQDSGAQRALVGADWLIRCRPGAPAKSPGQMVEALAW